MSCSTCWASVKSSSADGRIVLSPLRVGNTAFVFLNVLYVNGYISIKVLVFIMLCYAFTGQFCHCVCVMKLA